MARRFDGAQEADDTAMQGYVLLKKSQMAYDNRDALKVLALAEAAGHERWRLPVKIRAAVRLALSRGMGGRPTGRSGGTPSAISTE